MSNQATYRRGFTLVELLVVIAIIGVLVALMLPAVQSAREAARRIQCTNNQKQWVLAMHTYHDSHLTLPSGAYRPAAAHVHAYLWRASLLPNLEQGNLFSKINYTIPSCYQAAYEAGPNNPGDKSVAVYHCPSDPNAKKTYFWAGSNHMPTNYMGVSGGKYATSFDGSLYKFSQVRFQHFKDGMSNSVITGERGVPRNLMWGWALCGESDQDAYLSMALGISAGQDNASTSNLNKFWSYHSGGTLFGLADGSVRFLSYSTDFNSLVALATIDGGEVSP
ncbi:DUF1559 domain-containing protein [Anatilimnocola sp. NA78]|uniref:DUF1559 family PulG-like putative transporter n=1 Tax=Anatilimnocola sp. NA78 TaxID=3415683 RepID=UPI003CE5825F